MKVPAFFGPIDDVPARTRIALRVWGAFGLFSVAAGVLFAAMGAWLLATADGDGFADLGAAIAIGMGIITFVFGTIVSVAVHFVVRSGPAARPLMGLAIATWSFGIALVFFAVTGRGPPDLLPAQLVLGAAVAVLGFTIWPVRSS